VKEKRYIWVAQWKFGYVSDNMYWAAYMSKQSDLSLPFSANSNTTYTTLKDVAVEDLIIFIRRWEYQYDFIVVSHPQELETPFKSDMDCANIGQP
jgi:hypothetical protein